MRLPLGNSPPVAALDLDSSTQTWNVKSGSLRRKVVFKGPLSGVWQSVISRAVMGRWGVVSGL